MILRPGWPVLRRNYQTISTNRFIVDSPRFWRKEFHPKFSDLFTEEDFGEILNAVNEELPFKLSDTFIVQAQVLLYSWFAGYRFAAIPDKNPESPNQFIAELYFTLLDILPQIAFKQWQLKDDDFNVVSNSAETNKKDTSKLDHTENVSHGTKQDSELNIESRSDQMQQDTSSVENIDEQTDQNTKSVSDDFMSPQNQGVKPTTVSTKGQGVDGVTIASNPNFTTRTGTGVVGDTVVNKANTSGATKQASTELHQNNDMRSANSHTNDQAQTQSVEHVNEKGDIYGETLDFHRGARLQEFYDLGKDRLWLEIIKRLSYWVLQADIATGERNYNKCTIYPDGRRD